MPEQNLAESADVALEAVAEKNREHGSLPRWVEWASLSTMIMALISAVGGFMAGNTGDEAFVDRQKQIVDLIALNRMELRSELLLTRQAVIESAGKKIDQSLLDDIQATNQEVLRSTRQASKEVAASQALLQTNELFAIGTTILSVAITLTGMSVIVRQKRLWFGGIGISVVGAGFVVYGMFQTVAT